MKLIDQISHETLYATYDIEESRVEGEFLPIPLLNISSEVVIPGVVVRILDLQGRSVYEETVNLSQQKLRVNTDHLSSGNYELIVSKEEKVFSQVISIVH